MLYTKDKHMLGSCCVDVLLLLFAMVWCVWTAKSWLVRTQRAALSHVYCLPALCPSFYIFSLHRLHIQYVFVCDVVRSAASRFTLKHRWTFNTHQTLWHTSHRTGGLQHCLFSIQLCDGFFSLPSPCLRTNHIQLQDLLPGCIMGPQSLIVLFTSTVARVISHAEQKTWRAVIYLKPIPKGIIKV